METKVYKISDIAKIRSGKRLPAGHVFSIVPTLFPYIRSRDIKGGKILTDNLVYISHDTREILRRYIIEEGDIAITIVANIGDVGYCEAHCDKANLTENAVRLTEFDNQIVDSKYLCFYLGQSYMKQYMESLAAGAAQSKLGIYKIEKIKVFLPNFPIQQKIASILSAYDSLIENNTKRIRLLEQMAENLYKEWFVRFRFPGHENTKFKDGLPKGWSVKKYGEIAEIVAGGDCPIISSDIPTKDLSIPIYSNGVTNEGLYGYTNKARIKKPCITISARGTIGYICLRICPFVPIVRLLAVVPKNISVYYLFHYSRFNNLEGNGTSQQQLTKPMLQKRKILIPAQAVLLRFDMVVENIYGQKRKLKELNQVLARQRDLLLPRLMSGKLEVKA